MQDFISFVSHHWLLVGLLVLLILVLFIEEARGKGLMTSLTPADLVQLMNRESAVVVDIRNRDAFQEGHIIGAIHVSPAELTKDFTKLNKYKDRPLVVVCAMGNKAGETMMTLKKQGFANVRVLSGGINAWKNAQMPLVNK